MSLPLIHCCPGTLAESFTTYSPACKKHLFGNRNVSHILQYDEPNTNASDAQLFLENRKRLSISGVQEKVSMILDGTMLRLTEKGESGTYILKPIPRDIMQIDQVPANEHLTMQIARQVYGIETAENGLTFFKNGAPAYLTKRFDYNPDGSKRGIEDFATLAGVTSETNGPNFKYDYSYEEVAGLLKIYVATYPIEVEKFFRLVLFNYVFGNGDAHLKNFSIVEGLRGDYYLSPAYDLINTRLHVNDTDVALKDGIFKDFEMTPSFEANGFYAFDDFWEFGQRIGLIETRLSRILEIFATEHEEVFALINRSFLNEEMKFRYVEHYRQKVKAVGYSFSGQRKKGF